MISLTNHESEIIFTCQTPHCHLRLGVQLYLSETRLFDNPSCRGVPSLISLGALMLSLDGHCTSSSDL